jgi:hypothetical protein
VHFIVPSRSGHSRHQANFALPKKLANHSLQPVVAKLGPAN